MTITEKLFQLRSEGKAILAANFYNFETLSGILKASVSLNLPVILQLSEGSVKYLGLKTATAMARAAIEECGAESWLHLDHGGSVEMVNRCLDEGFDSVMIDASEKPFEENIEITSRVVELAGVYGVNVEAELGFVAKLGQEHNSSGFTQPADAACFVSSTGVHSLAVAIGSAHGFYKQPPKLDIDLLTKIREAVPVPLVLHGSSGIADTMLQDAIRNGITKVNLATETKNDFMLALKERLKDDNEIDLRIVFPYATKAVTALIEQKLKVINNLY